MPNNERNKHENKNHENQHLARHLRVSIAPMMKYTDRHYRYFMRGISKTTFLYTEMVCASTILRGNYDRYLAFDKAEHPIALQLGGDDPKMIYDAIQIASQYGYDEYNLNIGCPSPRVQSGNFGACLMTEPKQVANILQSMRDASDKPVTVKHRIGVDDHGSYRDLCNFISMVRHSNPNRYIVHARIALLSGLNPKENRNIPPIRYADVYRLKHDFPDLIIEINGQIQSMDEVEEHLRHCDGVMIGRRAYDDPFMFADVDNRIFGMDYPAVHRSQLVEYYLDYLDKELARGQSRHHILRHIVHLFTSCPGASKWRRAISNGASHDELREIASRITEQSDALPGSNQAATSILREHSLADPVGSIAVYS